MDTAMETWDSEENPNTKTLFYCGKNGPSTDKVFYSPNYEESLEEISPRTMEAFEKSLELDWEYMARAHSSTYVHKRNLVKFCETLPRENVLCGIVTEGVNPFIWGGCHFVFSRDVIEKFVANKDKWDTSVMEDVGITRMTNGLGIPVTGGHSATINQNNGTYTVLVYGHGQNFSFSNFDDIKDQLEDHFFMRVKQDLRREEDARIMRELKRVLK